MDKIKNLRNIHVFDNNIKQTEGVMSDIRTRIQNNVLYCVMCGRFTPDQRVVARQGTRVDTLEFMKLYTWLRENNIKFASHPDNPQCPTPIIIEEKDNKNSIDESVNPAIEKT